MTALQKDIYRIIDANLNRAREGLRVMEEIARFILSDAEITKRLKDLRHSLSRITEGLPAGSRELLRARDSQGDVGARTYTESEAKREDYYQIVSANMGRCQESIRVLEEFSKQIRAEAGLKFKEIRFSLYTLEKEILEKLEDLGVAP